MRPQEAKRIISKEMRKFHKASITDLPDLSILECFKKKRVYQALKQLEVDCERKEIRHLQILKELENDLENKPLTTGYDEIKPITNMYPYAISVEDILYKFHYISDRWYCAGRIKFILKVLEEI